MTRSLRLFVFLATLGLVALLPSASSASGWLRRCGGCCDSAPCTTTCAVEPRYEDRVVTCYKPVTRQKEIDVCVTKMVPREVKRIVMVPYTVTEKRTVLECVPTWRDVECKYVEMVPHVVKDRVKQTCIERRTREVEEVVPVCRVVCKPCVDECGRCYNRCERVTENVKVKRCVVDCVPVTREVEVCRTVCERVERTGMRRVCEYVHRERVVDVCRVQCRPEERTCTVWDCVPTTVKRTVCYCEMVPYETTIRVCVTPACDTGCDHGCGHGCGHRRFCARCY